MQSPNILIADDDAAIIAALSVVLNLNHYQWQSAINPAQTLHLVKQQQFDLILLDMNYQLDTTSGKEGLQLIEQIRALCNTPIVVMTAWSSVELSVQAMQKGANDFLEKPWKNERLLSVINNQLQLAKSRQQQHSLKQQLTATQTHFQAKDPISLALLQTCKPVAKSDLNLVILGENGTGKSLLAEHIHQSSYRAKGPFIVVNMSAIPENLFESEMFGHVKGAFTDAKQHRIGRFTMAKGGTLFLDEVANIPLSQQAKLLRVLESKTFEPVGSSQTQQADIRLISATNADLPKLIEQGLFRQDLYYRLAGFEVSIAPLKQRPLDITDIAQQKLQALTEKYQKPTLQFSSNAVQSMLDYDWPGNIRQLNHAIERAVVLCDTATIEAQHLGITSTQYKPTDQASLTMAQIEQQVIKKRLEQFEGNAIAAAKSLGISRSAFYRRLDKFKDED